MAIYKSNNSLSTELKHTYAHLFTEKPQYSPDIFLYTPRQQQSLLLSRPIGVQQKPHKAGRL